MSSGQHCFKMEMQQLCCAVKTLGMPDKCFAYCSGAAHTAIVMGNELGLILRLIDNIRDRSHAAIATGYVIALHSTQERLTTAEPPW